MWIGVRPAYEWGEDNLFLEKAKKRSTESASSSLLLGLRWGLCWAGLRYGLGWAKVSFYEGLWLREGESVVFDEGLWLREREPIVFFQ